MTTTFKKAQIPAVSLYTGLSAAGVSMVISPYPVDLQGNKITMAALQANPQLTIDPKVSGYEEIIGFTGIVDNGNNTATLTGLSRGLASSSLASGGTGVQHGAGAIIVFSINPQDIARIAALENDQTFTGNNTFTEPVTIPDPVADTDAANKEYVDDSVSAGAPNASNTVKGISKLSVAPASGTNPIAVGDNDPRMTLGTQSGTAYNSSTNKLEDNTDTSATSSAGKLVRANGSGLIDNGFLTGYSPTSVSQSFLAGQAINSGQPVAIFNYCQTDGGITYDNKAIGSYVTSIPNFTVGSGANRALVVFIVSETTYPSAITYGGSSMTNIDNQSFASVGQTLYLTSWLLLNPSSGSNTFVVTGGGTRIDYSIESFSNVAQSGQPDVNNKGTASSNTITKTLVTISTGSLIVSASAAGSGGSPNIFTSFTYNSISGNNVQSFNTGSLANETMAIIDTGIIGANQTITLIPTFSLSGGTNSIAICNICLKPYTTPALGVILANSKTQNTFYGNYRFIGFASSSVSAGAQVPVIMNGIATGLSGLAVAGQYYIQDTAGTIGTSAGTTSIKCGEALSSTTLLITNIW